MTGESSAVTRSTYSRLLAAAFCAIGSHAVAQVDAGAYLAARQAAAANDFAAAAPYFQEAQRADPRNPALLENALTSYVALGQFDLAANVAREIRAAGIDSQVGNLVLMAQAAVTDRWQDIFTALEEGHSVSPMVDGLAQAWAALGLGQMTDALASFDEVIESPQMRAFGLYHKALALASVGDFEGADAIFSLRDGTLAYNVRSAVAHAEVLSQLDRGDEALALLDNVFGRTRDPGVLALRAQLEAGEKLPYRIIPGARAGMAEIALMVATLLLEDAPNAFALQYARTASYLNPDDTQAILLSAELLDTLGQYDLATATYARVSPEDPSYHLAELGRIDSLRHAGKIEGAIEAAEALARLHPEMPGVHFRLGDVLRGDRQFARARDAYTAALDLYAEDDPARWMVLYSRAITSHQLDDWPPAEADFRAALALVPDQPQVLNYLGYSLVERGEKLDEARGMIETAAAAEPDNGAIVDSLGWILFTLGEYEAAVEPMERAAALEPVDPTINDHLGDVYWAVGRHNEAAFQWNRALSFDPEEDVAARIRRKLEVGLDAVLQEEGAPPLRLANDDR